jgi:hypothetical protein
MILSMRSPLKLDEKESDIDKYESPTLNSSTSHRGGAVPVLKSPTFNLTNDSEKMSNRDTTTTMLSSSYDPSHGDNTVLSRRTSSEFHDPYMQNESITKNPLIATETIDAFKYREEVNGNEDISNIERNYNESTVC